MLESKRRTEELSKFVYYCKKMMDGSFIPKHYKGDTVRMRYSHFTSKDSLHDLLKNWLHSSLVNNCSIFYKRDKLREVQIDEWNYTLTLPPYKLESRNKFDKKGNLIFTKETFEQYISRNGDSFKRQIDLIVNDYCTKIE